MHPNRRWRASRSRAPHRTFTPQVHHASYPFVIHPPRGLPSGRRPAVSDWASFRPRLTTTPLPFSLPSALRKPGNRTCTYEVTRHARRTRAANRRAPVSRAPMLGGVTLSRLTPVDPIKLRSPHVTSEMPWRLMDLAAPQPCLSPLRHRTFLALTSQSPSASYSLLISSLAFFIELLFASRHTTRIDNSNFPRPVAVTDPNQTTKL